MWLRSDLPDITLDFTYEDFMRMTKHGAMCDEQQRLGVREFERIIVRELRDFTEVRCLSEWAQGRGGRISQNACLGKHTVGGAYRGMHV